MRKLFVVAAALSAALSVTPAWAHVTVQPNEAIAGGFQTFFIQVPNERDDESTTEIEVEFPPVFASISFGDVEGWGWYQRDTNIHGALLPQQITEFTNAGVSVGIATVNMADDPFNAFNGFWAACSTYGSFSYLKYGPMRLFSQLAQERHPVPEWVVTASPLILGSSWTRLLKRLALCAWLARLTTTNQSGL